VKGSGKKVGGDCGSIEQKKDEKRDLEIESKEWGPNLNFFSSRERPPDGR